MKKVLLFVLIAIFAGAVCTQTVPAGFDISNYGVSVQPDKRVIVVLATLDAARSQDPSNGSARILDARLSPAGAAFRAKMDAELNVPEDLRQKISTFLTQYRKRRPSVNDADIVAPFVAMAYSLTAPPDLGDPIITTDLPSDLLDVLDFAPLVREFYRRSGIAAKLDQYVKDYQAASDTKLRGSTREMVAEILDYLHTKPQTVYVERVEVQGEKTKGKTPVKNVELREHERRFVIVPEMLAPAGNVQFLNVRDDYFVIVPPDTDLAVSDARRAFIQFVVDALVLKNAKDVSAIIPTVKQLLDGRRKINPDISPDPYLAVSRSLSAAIDAREAEYTKVDAATAIARQKIAGLKTDEEKRAVTAELEKYKQAQADETALRLSEDYEKGAVLDFYFAHQLLGVEESGFDVAGAMQEMLRSLDTSKESDRLNEFAEARRRALSARENRRTASSRNDNVLIENPVTKRLQEIEAFVQAKNYARASASLNDLLKANPSEPRIYYNLGRVATLQLKDINDPEEQSKKLIEAKNAYVKVIETSTAATDKALLSLTYVALAHIYEFYNDKDTSIKLYDKAIELADVPGGAYAQAMAGKQRLLKNP